MTPLHIAANEGIVETVEALANKIDVNIPDKDGVRIALLRVD